jgi:hypothetical protein
MSGINNIILPSTVKQHLYIYPLISIIKFDVNKFDVNKFDVNKFDLNKFNNNIYREKYSNLKYIHYDDPSHSQK